jgi:Holliday junction resolvase RusA-like endonuclease
VASAREALGKLGRVATLSALVGLAPVPASRPRVSRWGTYYAKNYAGWMKSAAKLLGGEGDGATDAPLMVLVEQVVEKPRTSKLAFPRGDVDNFAKGPLDAITKAGRVWKDDNQIVGLVVFKRFAEKGEEPGTRVDYVQLQGAA